jgi:hypothetical protein
MFKWSIKPVSPLSPQLSLIDFDMMKLSAFFSSIEPLWSYSGVLGEQKSLLYPIGLLALGLCRPVDKSSCSSVLLGGV